MTADPMPAIRFSGLEIRFLQDGSTTGGALDLFETIIQPKALMPVPHYHETWDETVYGLSGVTTWRVDGRDHEVEPGQSLFIPRGVVHAFRNDSDGVGTCLNLLTPGVLGPGYFQEMAALAASGKPDPAAMRAVMLRHGLVPSQG